MAYALVSNKLIDLYTNNNSIVHCTPRHRTAREQHRREYDYKRTQATTD